MSMPHLGQFRKVQPHLEILKRFGASQARKLKKSHPNIKLKASLIKWCCQLCSILISSSDQRKVFCDAGSSSPVYSQEMSELGHFRSLTTPFMPSENCHWSELSVAACKPEGSETPPCHGSEMCLHMYTYWPETSAAQYVASATTVVSTRCHLPRLWRANRWGLDLEHMSLLCIRGGRPMGSRVVAG